MAFYGAGTAGSAPATAIAWDSHQPRIMNAGPAPTILHGVTETNSQSFKAGCPVYLDSSGNVLVAAAGDTPIAGIALKSATNVTSANIEIPVLVPTPDQEFIINVSDGSGLYEASNTTCAEGIAYDIEVTNGIVTIASDDTTNPKFLVVKHILDTNGTATTQVLARLLAVESNMYAG